MDSIYVPLEVWCELESQQIFQARSLTESTTVHHNWKKLKLTSVMMRLALFWMFSMLVVLTNISLILVALSAIIKST